MKEIPRPRDMAWCAVSGAVVMRIEAGVFEIMTFAIPVVHGTYYPMLPSNIPWIHAGYQEFPPELGNESKYPYVRHY